MQRIRRLLPVSVLFATALATLATSANAQLTLEPAAVGRGFSLVTFVSNVPSVSGVGPLGVGLRTDGKVLVTSVDGTIRIYPNHLAGSTPESIVPTRGQGNAQSIAQVQQGNVWKYYLSQSTLGRIVEIDQDGNDVLPVPIVNLTGALCLIPYPPAIVNAHTGHLFATSLSSSDIYEIDPIAKTISTFKTNAGTDSDGLAFSPDGSILYVACPNDLVVKGFAVSDGALVWTSPVTQPPMHPDGIAIGTGTLTGFLYTNCNEGRVWEFGLPDGPHAGAVNLIAQGGSRGDFIASDPDVFCASQGHPSLLLTQTDRLLRLDPPGGGFFGPPVSSTIPVGPGSAAPPGPIVPVLGPIGLGVLVLLLAGAGAFAAKRSRAS